MATRLLGSDNTGDSGTLFKIVVRLCGLAVLAGVFLKFLFDASIIDHFKTLADPGSLGVSGVLKSLLVGSTMSTTLTKILIMLAYLVFPIIGISMVIRGKFAGGPFTFLILYNLAAFLFVLFTGPNLHYEGNFFLNTGIGYWISSAGIIAAFFAMFFLDKSI